MAFQKPAMERLFEGGYQLPRVPQPMGLAAGVQAELNRLGLPNSRYR